MLVADVDHRPFPPTQRGRGLGRRHQPVDLAVAERTINTAQVHGIQLRERGEEGRTSGAASPGELGMEPLNRSSSSRRVTQLRRTEWTAPSAGCCLKGVTTLLWWGGYLRRRLGGSGCEGSRCVFGGPSSRSARGSATAGCGGCGRAAGPSPYQGWPVRRRRASRMSRKADIWSAERSRASLAQSPVENRTSPASRRVANCKRSLLAVRAVMPRGYGTAVWCRGSWTSGKPRSCWGRRRGRRGRGRAWRSVPSRCSTYLEQPGGSAQPPGRGRGSSCSPGPRATRAWLRDHPGWGPGAGTNRAHSASSCGGPAGGQHLRRGSGWRRPARSADSASGGAWSRTLVARAEESAVELILLVRVVDVEESAGARLVQA